MQKRFNLLRTAGYIELRYKELKRTLRDIEENCIVKIHKKDFFFKKEDGFTLNDSEQIHFQYKWLEKVNEALEEITPKPIAFLKIGRDYGYLMDIVNGETLEQKLKNPESKEKIKREFNFDLLYDSIKELHRRELPHGDLDPSNIMISHNNRFVLIDPFKHPSLSDGIHDDLSNLKRVREFVFNA
ncbi:MAG: hypothetical protein ACP5M9_02240 [Candidatus Micrarchaeia archaeon]